MGGRDRQPEAGLQCGLVEAREEAPRVGGLELREGVLAVAGARGVEASQVAGQLAAALESESGRAGGARAGEHDLHRLAIRPRDDAAANALLAEHRLRLRHIQRDRVQLERALAAGQLEAMPNLRRERVAASRIHLDVEIGLDRAHVGGKAYLFHEFDPPRVGDELAQRFAAPRWRLSI